MPRVLGPTTPVGMVRPGQSRAERAIARIAGPAEVGVTLYRLDGDWRSARTPSQDVLDSADRVILGGHETDISGDDYDEIIEAGFELTVLPIDQEDYLNRFFTAAYDGDRMLLATELDGPANPPTEGLPEGMWFEALDHGRIRVVIVDL